jgi:hypothetical protein
MINFEKMDEKDFVFLSKPLSEKEEKDFSEFLKSKRTRPLQSQRSGKSKIPDEVR